jgi:hypothetical protein
MSRPRAATSVAIKIDSVELRNLPRHRIINSVFTTRHDTTRRTARNTRHTVASVKLPFEVLQTLPLLHGGVQTPGGHVEEPENGHEAADA